MAKRYFENHEHSIQYANYRPSPPQPLIEHILSKTKCRNLAMDIGCGTGQSTKLLAPYFKKIVGLDVSESQICVAKQSNTDSNLEFRVGLFRDGYGTIIFGYPEFLKLLNTCYYF